MEGYACSLTLSVWLYEKAKQELAKGGRLTLLQTGEEKIWVKSTSQLFPEDYCNMAQIYNRAFPHVIRNVTHVHNAERTTEITSSWDGRRWRIREHLTCSTPKFVCILWCRHHPDLWYVDSTHTHKHPETTMGQSQKWCSAKKNNDQQMSNAPTRQHLRPHHRSSLSFFVRIRVETVRKEEALLSREIYW